ncbi:hypothetical protein H8356DRAFT_1346334 [Neocallimastix lanati (nom. inval.)]|nr:hypothetical protein H8356DRAFT_1346334 [Neocallimastix sp. JGI-2020a]
MNINNISSSNTSTNITKTTKTKNTLSTTMNDAPVEHSGLKLLLDSEELDDCVLNNHQKYDSTIRIIILNSLDKYTKSLLNNYTSVYLMINELKERFSETEIENDEFKLYLENFSLTANIKGLEKNHTYLWGSNLNKSLI